MYRHDVWLLGLRLSEWDLVFLIGTVAGYPILRTCLRRRRGGGALPRLLPLRWITTVYVSVIGAQLFAYAFDLNTSLLPPRAISPARYYLDPLFGPKTLYGAIVFLPLTVLAISAPWRDLRYTEALDAWTPPMFVVLGVARVGCFLHGCCYGMRSAWLGVSFPPRGALYWSQVRAKLIAEGSWTLPVVPTQLIEAVGLFVLAVLTFGQLRQGRALVFPPAVAAYSVFRFALEFVRADPDRNVFGPLSTSQWIAVVVVGAYLLWWRQARP